jgi:hypothetical protein
VRLGPHDPDHIRRLAAHVDQRITEIRGLTHISDTQRLLILVCLNLADELFRAKSDAVTTPVRAGGGRPEGAVTPGPDALLVLDLLEKVIVSGGGEVPPWPQTPPASPSP